MGNESGRPSILSETSDDESFLLGTRAQLTELARRLLQLAESPTEWSTWDGTAVSIPTCSPSLTDPMSEIALSGVVVVESETDRRNLMNKIRVNNGLDPIDWEGHDQNRASDE